MAEPDDRHGDKTEPDYVSEVQHTNAELPPPEGDSIRQDADAALVDKPEDTVDDRTAGERAAAAEAAPSATPEEAGVSPAIPEAGTTPVDPGVGPAVPEAAPTLEQKAMATAPSNKGVGA